MNGELEDQTEMKAHLGILAQRTHARLATLATSAARQTASTLAPLAAPVTELSVTRPTTLAAVATLILASAPLASLAGHSVGAASIALFGNSGSVSRSQILHFADREPAAILAAAYGAQGFDLDAVRAGNAGVPRIFVSHMPEDLGALDDIAARKTLFVQTVLPHILRVNERILEERAHLAALVAFQRRGGELARREQAWIAERAEMYGGSVDDLEDLLARMDIVPPALTLAQAALESGWGTSRFARRANALFGQYTYSAAHGMAPAGQEDDPPYLIRVFPSIGASVEAYVHNLNSHRAYARMRALRKQQRQASGNGSGVVWGLPLAQALTRYSERGQAYVADVEGILRSNGFEVFDTVRLAPKPPGHERIADAS